MKIEGAFGSQGKGRSKRKGTREMLENRGRDSLPSPCVLFHRRREELRFIVALGARTYAEAENIIRSELGNSIGGRGRWGSK